MLSKKYELKTQRIGHGWPSEGQVLKRVVRRTAKGFELEADLRHAELIVERLGLQDAKPVSTQGVGGAASGGGDDGGVAVEDVQELPPVETTMFRCIAARCNGLQPDWPDIHSQ